MSSEQTFQAATTIIARDAGELEVLMVKRHHQIDFVAGAMVFPGGKVHDDDHDPAWAGHVRNWSGVQAEERALRIAAIRECFEECGIILGDPGGAAPGPEMTRARQAVDRREVNFLDYVREKGIVLDLARLTMFARWMTPPIMPKRFDTFFYLVETPAGQSPISDGRETVEAEWIAPAQALALAARGEREIVFPTRMNLQLLAQSPSFDEAVTAARARPARQVTPRVVTREEGHFLQLDEQDGYGVVEELFKRS